MTKKKQRRGSDRKDDIIRAILSARVKSKTMPVGAQSRKFLSHYFADVPVSDLAGRSPKIMAQIAFSHLELGAQRRKGRPNIRIFNPTEEKHGYTSSFTFIEMVHDDMPFIVNSITTAINRHDLTVHITVHPIIRVRRDKRGNIDGIADLDSNDGQRESFVRLAIDREADPHELKQLEQVIGKVLADIKLSVRDWH